MNTVENEVLNINIDNYSGPLDVLLELAKTQKVDLAQDLSKPQFRSKIKLLRQDTAPKRLKR